MKLRENDAPFSSRWEQYSFESGFSGGTTNPPLDDGFWDAMNVRCLKCGRAGEPEVIKST